MKQSNLISTYMDNNQLDIEQVMTDFTPYLYTIMKNKNTCFSSEDREEMISDVFVAVWKNQEKLDGNLEMKAYLVGIMRNVVCKKMRNFKVNVAMDDFEYNLCGAEDVEFEVENQEKNQIILSELNNMKGQDREIFMLYYYFARSMKEIAIEMNISEAKVKSRLFRIRRKLKKALEKRGYHYGA